MSKDVDKSTQLKAEGNNYFQQGNFTVAESLYSKAIIADDTNPSLYTNRAMARLRLEYYDSAISDCNTCLKLTGGNMKAYFVLSQCQLAIEDYEGALDSAFNAHRICAETNDKSLAAVTNQVLRCKKTRWDDMEKKRSRESQELEQEVIGLMQREREDMINSCDNDFDRRQVKDEWNQKIKTMKATFEKARKASEQRRDVPDWAIDDISFCVMVDPVMTKTGKSYERASIMEHLRRHPTDPLTREPLQPGELRPNLGLKQACEEYLEQNGWAVDW